MKLKYFIEFSEVIEDISDLEDIELTKIRRLIERELYKYLSYSGLQIGDFKLEFDLEECEK